MATFEVSFSERIKAILSGLFVEELRGQLLCAVKWSQGEWPCYVSTHGKWERSLHLKFLLLTRVHPLEEFRPPIIAFLGEDKKCHPRPGEELSALLEFFNPETAAEESEAYFGDAYCLNLIKQTATQEILRPRNIIPEYWARMLRNIGVRISAEEIPLVYRAMETDFRMVKDNRSALIRRLSELKRKFGRERVAKETETHKILAFLDMKIAEYQALGFR